MLNLLKRAQDILPLVGRRGIMRGHISPMAREAELTSKGLHRALYKFKLLTSLLEISFTSAWVRRSPLTSGEVRIFCTSNELVF